MARSIYEINQDIIKYKELKDRYTKLNAKIIKIIENLNNSTGYFNKANENLKKYYTVNDASVDKGKINDIKNDITSISKKLYYEMRILVNNRIYEINNRLNLLNIEKRSAEYGSN